MDWSSFRCECIECRSEPFAESHNRSEGSATAHELSNLSGTSPSDMDTTSAQVKPLRPVRTVFSITENIEVKHQPEPQGIR